MRTRYLMGGRFRFLIKQRSFHKRDDFHLQLAQYRLFYSAQLHLINQMCSPSGLDCFFKLVKPPLLN
jgi:hypothetical protein